MKQDLIIAEVRKNRELLLARFDYDLAKLVAYLNEKERLARSDSAKTKKPKPSKE